MAKVVQNPKLLIPGAGVLLLAFGLWAFSRPNSTVLILDPRFQVLTVNWSSGTNHVLFQGNQREGRLRDWLIGMGLRIKGIPACHFRTDKSSRGLLIRYTGTFGRGELNEITAELLTSPGNKTIPLRSIMHTEDTIKKEFVGVWVIEWVTNSGSEFKIKLRTASSDLAEIIGNKL